VAEIGSHRRAYANWSKGFLQVWIVLSVAYGATALCFQDYTKVSNIWTIRNPAFTFEYPSGEKYVAETAKDSRTIYAEITEFLKKEVRRLEQKGNVSDTDKIKNDLIHQSDDIFNTVNTQTALIRDQNKHDGYVALITAI
jgi:hypothetical protein